jgi:hypothetical protein
MSGSPFGILEYQAAGKASEAQTKAAELAAQTQLQMYETSREDLAPWRQAGEWALNQLIGTPGTSERTIGGQPIYGNAGGTAATGNALAADKWVDPGGYWTWEEQTNWETGQPELKKVYVQPQSYLHGDMPPQIGGAGAQQTQSQITGYTPTQTIPATEGTPGLLAGPGEFTESPSYQFVLGEGLKGIQRGASATGRLGSGAYMKDVTKYAEGLASTEYDNFLRRYYESLNPYFSLAGMGQISSGQSATNALTTGNALAQTYQNQGAAQAAGILGQGQAMSNQFGYAGNALGNWAMQNYGSGLGGAGYGAAAMPTWGAGGAGWSGTTAGSAAGANMMLWL